MEKLASSYLVIASKWKIVIIHGPTFNLRNKMKINITKLLFRACFSKLHWFRISLTPWFCYVCQLGGCIQIRLKEGGLVGSRKKTARSSKFRFCDVCSTSMKRTSCFALATSAVRFTASRWLPSNKRQGMLRLIFPTYHMSKKRRKFFWILSNGTNKFNFEGLHFFSFSISAADRYIS